MMTRDQALYNVNMFHREIEYVRMPSEKIQRNFESMKGLMTAYDIKPNLVLFEWYNSAYPKEFNAVFSAGDVIRMTKG